MGKRLNDTAAVAAMPVPTAPGVNKTCEVSVREISNGYIERRTTYGDGMDDYKSSETYHSTPPEMPKERESPRGNSLRGAIKSLK